MRDNEDGISICICTYRRPSVIATIKSVATQRVPGAANTHTIVIDNDTIPSSKDIVETYCQSQHLELTFIHAPAQNISVARNAALAATRTRWLAFIDDDERASSTWLSALYSNRFGAAAVFGPVQAIYPSNAPKWLSQADLLSSTPFRLRNGSIITGYSGNVLIDMEFVRRHKLRFDKKFGKLGGEDTIFFNAMHRRGGHLAYAPGAIAYEEVSNIRTTLPWVIARRYRAGQTYAMLQQRYNVRKYRQIPLLSPIKIAFCAGIASLLAIRPSRAMWWLMRGVFHWGMLTYRLNGNVYQEYWPSVVQEDEVPRPNS